MTHRALLLGLAVAAAGCAPSTELPVGPGDEPTGRPELGPPPAGNNATPVVVISSPADGATIGTGVPIDLVADFSDADAGDTHTCSLDWQIAAAGGAVTESGGSGSCAGSFTYPVAGSYQIVVAVIDNLGNTAMDTVTVTVADAPPPPPPPTPPPPVPPVPPATPNAGSVWGDGMMALKPVMIGKATRRPPTLWFAIGASVDRKTGKARGGVEIVVPNVDLKLRATGLDRLRVEGNRAEIRGTGRVGRVDGYAFLITIVDDHRRGFERRERIRVKVWNAGGVLLDTEPGVDEKTDPTGRLDRGGLLLRP